MEMAFEPVMLTVTVPPLNTLQRTRNFVMPATPAVHVPLLVVLVTDVVLFGGKELTDV